MDSSNETITSKGRIERCVMDKMALNTKCYLTLAAIAGCVTVAFIAGRAHAADLPNVPGLYSEPGSAAGLTWAGSYAGLQIGAGQMAGEATSNTKSKYDRGGFAGGIYAGHNWEMSRFVLGLEADLTYLGHKKSFSHSTLGHVKVQNNWSAGLKGRIGLPIDRFMPYLSAGMTASDFKMTANGTRKESANLSINLGAGLEYALSDKMHLRADYSLNGLSHDTENFGGANVKSEAAAHRLMLGISYNF